MKNNTSKIIQDKHSIGNLVNTQKNTEQTALFVHIRGNAFFLYAASNNV